MRLNETNLAAIFATLGWHNRKMDHSLSEKHRQMLVGSKQQKIEPICDSQ